MMCPAVINLWENSLQILAHIARHWFLVPLPSCVPVLFVSPLPLFRYEYFSSLQSKRSIHLCFVMPKLNETSISPSLLDMLDDWFSSWLLSLDVEEHPRSIHGLLQEPI